MLPTDNRIRKETDKKKIAEERRVLFVGATRAKKKLLVGDGDNIIVQRIDNSGRPFRIFYGKWGVQTEIGRSGDFDENSVASSSLCSISQADNLQEWLWINQDNNTELYSEFSRGEQGKFIICCIETIKVRWNFISTFC